MRSKRKRNRPVEIDDGILDPRNHKVRITTFIDGDILLWLRAQAAKDGGKYQSYLNRILREQMAGSLDDRIRKIVRDEIKKSS